MFTKTKPVSAVFRLREDTKKGYSKRQMTLMLKAITHPLRNEILAFLDEKRGKASFDEIAKNVETEKTSVSLHLRLLERSQVVRKTGEVYKINSDLIEKV